MCAKLSKGPGFDPQRIRFCKSGNCLLLCEVHWGLRLPFLCVGNSVLQSDAHVQSAYSNAPKHLDQLLFETRRTNSNTLNYKYLNMM